jgi:biotin carboxyl carrier protein
MKHTLLLGDVPHEVWLSRKDGEYVLLSEYGEHPVGEIADAVVVADGDNVFIHSDGAAYAFRYQDTIAHFAEEASGDKDYIARAPMPGSLISVAVSELETIAAGKTLVVIESMKLETAIKAPRDGIVQTIHFKIGQTFDRDAALVTLSKSES